MDSSASFNRQATQQLLQEHCQTRNASLQQLKLPYQSWRPGQKETIQAILKSIRQNEFYLLNAPTGFGKTSVSLIPALIALSKDYCQQIYYFTAKESTRALPAQFLAEIKRKNPQIKLWSLTLYGVERLCLQHEFCYFRSTKQQLKDLALRYWQSNPEHIIREHILELAKTANVCPYSLMLQLAEFADFLILDYNYLLDPKYRLGAFNLDAKKVVLLFDEAHNLLGRTQANFSAKVDFLELKNWLKLLKNYDPLPNSRLANLLQNLTEFLQQLLNIQTKLTNLAATNCDAAIFRQSCWELFNELPDFSQNVNTNNGVNSSNYVAFNKANLLQPKNDINTTLPTKPEAEIISDSNDLCYQMDQQLLQLYLRKRPPKLQTNFAWLTAELSACFKELQAELNLSLGELKKWQTSLQNWQKFNLLLQNYWQAGSLLNFNFPKLKGLDAKALKQALAQFNWQILNLGCSELLLQQIPKDTAAIFFSATLLPLKYYQTLFARSEQVSHCQSLVSSFLPEQKEVAVLAYLDLSYQRRQFNYLEVAESLLSYLEVRAGHLLVFCPSYYYMQQLAATIVPFLGGSIDLIMQPKPKQKAAYPAFLKRLKASNNPKPLIALAVLQGAFSEGIDLPGAAITAVAIISVALTPPSIIKDLGSQYFIEQQMQKSGYSASELRQLAYLYTDIYPSYTKILQACGRLIRSENDTGEILLLDQRFTRPEYRDLLESLHPYCQIIKSTSDYEKWLRHLR